MKMLTAKVHVDKLHTAIRKKPITLQHLAFAEPPNVPLIYPVSVEETVEPRATGGGSRRRGRVHRFKDFHYEAPVTIGVHDLTPYSKIFFLPFEWAYENANPEKVGTSRRILLPLREFQFQVSAHQNIL
ncbi:unnamed protein product [Orchesella dallaii]|uniref:Uncharacterized protein n=1 Tax=Orchesella dallaii TaxID=48710 RepID=A0ABP1R848_9HEXA